MANGLEDSWFAVESVVRGHHVYKRIWTLILQKVLQFGVSINCTEVSSVSECSKKLKQPKEMGNR